MKNYILLPISVLSLIGIIIWQLFCVNEVNYYIVSAH